MSIRRTAVILCSAMLAILGCSTTTTQSFKVAKDSKVEAAFIATDADFSKYHQLQAIDMGIHFPTNSGMTDADVLRVRQIFRQAFLGRLIHYKISELPGPGTLAVEATLIDLRKATSADVPRLRIEIRDVAQPGALVFLMELRDSETKRVLARAADRTAKPDFATGNSKETDWDTVQAAADHWATLFRNFLDNNLGK